MTWLFFNTRSYVREQDGVHELEVCKQMWCQCGAQCQGCVLDSV